MTRSGTIEQSGLKDVSAVTAIAARKLTYRESLVVRHIIEGKPKGEALRLAGFPESVAINPFRVVTPEVQSVIDEMQAALAQYQLDHALIDATEILEQLTDEARGDLADLYDDQGEPLPIKQWPMWARQGGVEFIDEPNMVPSGDGEGKSWDQVGRKIRIIGKPRTKTRELAMKHKGVNAMVQAPAAQVQVNVIDAETVQLATLLSPEQLESVRQRVIAGSSGVALDVPKTVIST